MPNMVLNRDDVFVSTRGNSYGFKKGVPLHVSPKLIPEALRFGASLAEGEDEAGKKEFADVKAGMDREEQETADRKPKIVEAIQTMLKRNLAGDFTAGGKPNLNQMAKLTKFTVTTEELDPIWKEIKAEL